MASEDSSSLAPALLTEKQAASFLGVGLNTFGSLREEPWMPKPIQLGPRLLRWARSELDDAIANMPRQRSRVEQPAELRRARIERMKAGS